jgi:hypothetical protein
MRILFLSLLISSTTFAQRDTINLDIQLGAQYSDGNIVNKSVTGAVNLRGRKSKTEWGLNPTYKYMEAYPYPVTSTSTPSRQNEFYMPSHISYRNDSSWKIILFSEVEHSQLRKVQIRLNLGAGVTKKFIRTKHVVWELSGVFLPDYFQTMKIKNTITERDNLSFRISVRSKLIIKTERFTVNSIQALQPAIYSIFYNSPDQGIGWSDNLNFRSTNSIDFPVSKALSFGVAADFIYQSYLGYLSQDPGVLKTGIYLSPRDLSFSFYLKYKK